MERKCWLKKFLKADAFIIALGGARGLTMPLAPPNHPLHPTYVESKKIGHAKFSKLTRFASSNS
ncbi:MAG: hypothetical protein E7F47_07310 [Peptoniphilus harei]|nr:hypothetical protein [Peptoniphilus harei]